MWDTTKGLRILQGAETALVRDSIYELVDEDWKLQDLSIDLDPEKANHVKAFLGIERDYFIDIPPDDDESPPEIVWADLIELVAGTRPDPDVFN